MTRASPLRRVALLAPLAALALSACAQTPDMGRAAAFLSAALEAGPRTERLAAAPAPAARPAAPVAADFTARDLLGGGVIGFDVAREGASATVRQSDGCVWSRSGDWFAPSASWRDCGEGAWATGRAEVRRVGSIWPLQPGAEGGYTRKAVAADGRSYERATDCRVTGAEAVVRENGARTPAWVVACTDGKRTRTTWWAPGEGPVAFRKAHAEKGVEEAWVRL